MTTALRDDGVRVSVDEALQDADGKHRYYCADCKNIHHRDVELIPVKAHEHSYTREKMDMNRAQPVVTSRGDVVERTKMVWQPSHFKRAGGAEKHACDHDVAYSAFRSAVLYFNGHEIDRKTRANLIPVMPPRHGAFEVNGANGVQFRQKGMKRNGVRDALEFGRLLNVFEDHAGLQHYQYFKDHKNETRRFAEFHFEDGRALFDYLDRHDAVGRANSILCSYVMNPNTSYQAREKVPEKNGFIDRDVSHLPDGRKLNVFARGSNHQSIQALSNAAYEHGVFNKSLVHIFGECWIEDTYLDAPAHHVEIEIYDPRQVTPWNRKGGFVPPYNPCYGNNDLVLPL